MVLYSITIFLARKISNFRNILFGPYSIQSESEHWCKFPCFNTNSEIFISG